ncbi:MAG: hypothetical protein AAB538_03180 [Patescibacteria group bacterium]
MSNLRIAIIALALILVLPSFLDYSKIIRNPGGQSGSAATTQYGNIIRNPGGQSTTATTSQYGNVIRNPN